MMHGLDARQMCGEDVRRYGFWPSDEARAEGLVARYGGMLTAMPIHDVAVCLRWEPDTGEAIQVTAPSVQEALERLTTTIRASVSSLTQ